MAKENDVFPEQVIKGILAREEAAQEAFNELIGAKVNEDQLILDLCNIHLNPVA